MIWLLLNLALFVLLDYLLVLIHEFGHVSAAKLVRFRVLSVRVGYGKRLVKSHIFGIPTIINAFPYVGLTNAVPVGRKWIRPKLWIYAAGGPAVHVGFLLLAFILSPASFYLGHILPTITSQVAPIEVFVLVNVVVLALNIIPRRIGSPVSKLYTDGYRLAVVPFMRKKTIHELIRSVPRIEAWELIREGNYGEALEIYERELAKSPDDNYLRHDRAIALLHFGKFVESRDILVSLTDSEEFKDERVRILLGNNIAWLDAVLGEAGKMERADEYSKIAYDSAPENAMFCGTRGSVLVRMGRIKEGIGLLKKSFKVCPDPDGRSVEACFLALAYHLQGDATEADQWIKIASRESPNYVLIEFMRTEIGRLGANKNGDEGRPLDSYTTQ